MEHTLIPSTETTKAYVQLRFTGDLTSDKVDLFKDDLAVASEAIQNYFKESGKRIHILLDMSEFTGNYSLDSLTALVGFAKNNKIFVEKTASFGGSDKVQMAGEVAITLSGRDNIKIFETQKEAEEWLRD